MLLTELDQKLWDPYQAIREMRREMNRLFQDKSSLFPAVNIFRNDKEVLVKTELAGLNPENIEISVDRNRLTIKGTRSWKELDSEKHISHLAEIQETGFERTLNLPFAVDTQNVQAKYSQGVLEIHLPKTSQDSSIKIPVQVA